MNINDFKSALSGGGARPNLYRVNMLFPISLGVGGADESRKLSFTCKTAELPGSTLGVIEQPYMGRVIKLAGDRTFEAWNITVMVDTDFKTRDAFEKWSNAINSHVAYTGVEQPSSYQSDAIVEQLDKNGEVIKSYTFKGMWPSEISTMELAMDSNDTISEFTATMQYDYWESNTTS